MGIQMEKPKLTGMSEELQFRVIREIHLDKLLGHDYFERMDIDLTILIKKVIADTNDNQIFFSKVDKIFGELRDSREFEMYLNSVMALIILIHKEAFESGRQAIAPFTVIKNTERTGENVH